MVAILLTLLPLPDYMLGRRGGGGGDREEGGGREEEKREGLGGK